LQSTEEIENEETFNGSLAYMIVTKASKQEIIHIVNSISDIRTVSLMEITNENIHSFSEGKTVQLTSQKLEQPEKLTMNEEVKVSQTVRVDVSKLEYLMNLVGEIVIDQTRLNGVRSKLLDRYPNDEDVETFQEIANHLSQVVSELQEGIMKTRMLPIEQLFNRFPRMVRDLAQKAGKEIDFVIEGKETELDRNLIEKISDPIIHLLRNSLDHGIESPSERAKKGKPTKGTIMNKAETGDLTVHIDYEAKDELGGLANSFNQMIEGVKETVVQVSEHARSLAASSEEISASTEEIANGAQEQARAAMASSEMMNEMANAVQDISKNAEGAAEATEQTVAAAEQGKKAIEEVLQGMNEISVRIHDLADKSTQIGEIIEVIDDIAEQTNLLALNAAIEAARAGEAGKGFAVVADEVRKLAERSGKATKEISELIESIQENTASSVAAVNAGNEKTNNAGVMFEDIVKHVKQSSKRVVEILAASEEGASQSQEVLRAVESIASVSEETAASVEQTAATANDLAKMAEMLNHLAEKFKVMK
jgi:methyl-accepting chemotaxis protein